MQVSQFAGKLLGGAGSNRHNLQKKLVINKYVTNLQMTSYLGNPNEKLSM